MNYLLSYPSGDTVASKCWDIDVVKRRRGSCRVLVMPWLLLKDAVDLLDL